MHQAPQRITPLSWNLAKTLMEITVANDATAKRKSIISPQTGPKQQQRPDAHAVTP
jgi:hypothetical protein